VDPRTAKIRMEPSAAAVAEGGRSRSLAPHLSEGGLRNTKTPMAATQPVADIKVDVRGDPDSSIKHGQAGDIEMGPMDHDRSVNSKDNSPLLLQQVRTFSPVPRCIFSLLGKYGHAHEPSRSLLLATSC